jgi:hypothetical protein
MYMRGPGLSAREIEEIKRRQTGRDYSVKPRPAPKRNSERAVVEQLRRQLLHALKS